MDTLLAQIGPVIDWLVAGSGLVSWLLFVPQIKRIYNIKEANAISLGMTWGSWVLQVLILTQALLHANWQLAFTMGMSVLFLTITNAFIHYYRAFPGGRKSGVRA